jgi:hypothetical protein
MFACVCLGVFGAAFAVTGLLTALPPPAAGGTCGPGQGSEAAIVAIFDPITIGAGPKPPATNPSARSQWSAFVHDCQTAADHRALATFPILLVSIALVIIGPLVWRRSSRRRGNSTPEGTEPIAAHHALNPTPSSGSEVQVDPAEQLRKLSDLHQSGLLTDEEFAAKRAVVIDRLVSTP